LGGRLDATNVVTPAISVLTPIGLDHQQILGNTLVEIAFEKCGIIKPGVPVVSAPQQPDAAAVILAKARELGSHCEWVTEPWTTEVSLVGQHQRWNAALAVMALDAAATNQRFLEVGFGSIERALSSARWPGRFQRVRERLVLDGAHNPSAMETLAATWRAEYAGTGATVILGMMRDKDVRAVIPQLTPMAARVFTVPVQNARALGAADLAALVRTVCPDLAVTDYSSLSAALKAASIEKEPTLVTGSLFLVGETLVELGMVDAAGERSEQ
jgi:dihydrofolate synthase/folylpolyglutamate synthase